MTSSMGNPDSNAADSRFTLMAQYNQWMNQNLYGACEKLPEAELHTDRGVFFGSIFLTLNHILYGDLAFLSRFTGEPSVVPELGEALASSFEDLRHQRETLDERIRVWASELTNEWLDETQTYRSKVDGKTRTIARWALVSHMFNHQTHHRGQVTALLSQLGVDYGSTDIPFMPRFVAV